MTYPQDLLAEKTLIYYRDITNSADPMVICVLDLVADLMHYCANRDIDWDEIAKVAKEQVDSERGE